ncbi:MAG: branched-chain amino acid ABC transporter substrate-binding protein [Ktedonobacterales bacterium]
MYRNGIVLRLRQRLLTVLATCALLLALSSCSAGGSTTNAPQHLVIATLFATSGTDAATQLPAQYGVDLAVSQAHLPDGYTLSVVHEDYEGAGGIDQTIGAAQARALVNNAHVVGVVGPFDGAVTRAAMPITNLAGLSMISPTNTIAGLTLQQYTPALNIDWNQLHPPGRPNRYFRTVANDVEQGQLDAYLASYVLGARTVFVVDDNTAYGVELARSFSTAFTSNAGHTVVSFTGFDTSQFSYFPMVASIVTANPDLVFYGGVTSGGGGDLKRFLVAAGYTKPLLGGDGIANDPAWLTTAQEGAGDTYGTIAAPDVSALTSRRAQAFVSAYEAYIAGKPDNTLTPYSVMAYDAANTLIQALTMAIKQGAGRPLSYFRAQTGQDLASSSYQYDGITGDISFDEHGDNSGQRIFSVYEVRGSSASAYHWSFFQLLQCSGTAWLTCREIPNL